MFHPEDAHIYLKNLPNKQIKGKDGLVDAYTIQKHKPTENMLFIVLDTGDSLFCQKNHPLWVYRDKQLIEINEAKDLIPYKDSIWVDKTILNTTKSFIPDSNTVNLVEFLINNKSKKFFLLKIFLDIKDSINIRFEPNFIKYDTDWCIDLINELYKQTEGIFYTRSVLLCQQIKMLCDKIRIPSELGTEIKVVDDTARLFFTLKFNADKCINLLEKGYSLVKSVTEIPLEIYSEDVYDISTKSKEFIISNVQTHNSFHSFLKDCLLYVKENNEYKITTFEQLWNKNNNSIININGQEEKNVEDLYIFDKDKFTKVLKVIRHPKPKDVKMMMIRSNNSDFIIAQDDHPNMFSLEEHTDNYIPICPKDHLDKIVYSYNNFPIWQSINESKTTPIDPYLFGMFLGEGSYLYYHEGKDLEGFIITQGKGPIQDKILNEVCQMDNIRKYSINGQQYRSAEQIIIYSKELAEKMISVTNRYSRQRSIGEDFIYYSDEILSKIICGFIDAEGSHVQKRNVITLECTSVLVIQQLHHILNKFLIKHKIWLATVKELTNHQSYVIWMYPDDTHKDIFKYSIKVNTDCFKSPINRKSNSKVNYIKEILFDGNEFTYDLTTESHTLTVNGIYSHNTGGSAALDRFDIKNEIMSNLDEGYRSTIEIIFQQFEDSLTFNSDYCTLTIDKGFFEKFDEKLKKTDEFIILPVGYMTFKYNNLTLPIAIEQETMVYLTEERQVSTNIIELSYTKGQKILKVIPKQIQPEKIAQSLDGLVGGKSPWLTPEGLFMKFYKILGPLGSFDSVYLETIMSNILRNKKEPQYPARLKVPYDPATFSIKSLPSLNSYVLGICFENLSKSLTFGLLSERTDPSEIEKVMFGDPLSQLSIDILKQNRKR